MIRFLAIDIETLGMDPPAAIIELGWTSVDLFPPETEGEPPSVQFGHLAGDQRFGIPEGQDMSPSNRAVHHIHPASLGNRPLFDELAWTTVLEETGTDYLVAHNSSFEQKWLTSSPLPWICTYKCALRAWPDAPGHGNQVLKYWLDHEDKTDYYPPHRALPDAKVTAQHLWRLLLEHPVETLVQWTKEPSVIQRLPFGKHKGMLITDAPSNYLAWIVGPDCKAADPDLRHSCRTELYKRPG